jgi:pyrimidine-nucleoside phosphorylase
MSKKLAAGPASIVMDVKWGSGAFMRTIEDARALASSLTAVGRHMGRKVTSFITDMNQPLGRMVGNSLETIEAIDCLQGRGPADIMELTRTQAGEMLVMAGRAPNFEQGCTMFDQVIADGSAFEKFVAMVENQGGDAACLRDVSRFPAAAQTVEVRATASGFVQEMDSVSIGIAGIMLGGGRERSEDTIDHSVGIEVLKKCGDEVAVGEPLAIIHAADNSKTDAVTQRYLAAVRIGSSRPSVRPLVVERI